MENIEKFQIKSKEPSAMAPTSITLETSKRSLKNIQLLTPVDNSMNTLLNSTISSFEEKNTHTTAETRAEGKSMLKSAICPLNQTLRPFTFCLDKKKKISSKKYSSKFNIASNDIQLIIFRNTSNEITIHHSLNNFFPFLKITDSP